MKIEILKWFASLIVLMIIACGPDMPPDVTTAYENLPSRIDYNFHIKPILSDRCYSCHGPDEVAREAGFRLDIEEEAKARLENNHHAIVEGNPGKSVLCARIFSSDPTYQMPPPDSKLNLTAREKALLVKWIEQGAEYKKHWAFIPPANPALPPAQDADWIVNNEIDLFIQRKVKQQGLQPGPQADKEILLKRLYMDLTGLPPDIEAIDAFLEDTRQNSYEVIVDQLLESDACAERLALEWMDVARYADSHGLHADGWRNMWPWRDWVIHAFRDNMPYNQFVTEQLAGDLLPDPTRDQILATAFHRNHPMTAEGGAIDEEFRLEYVADRTNTTATALMGLTMECARCHDHKFDPISQKEYYQMTAFFNNVREIGMTGDDGNYGPLMQILSPEAEQKVADIRLQINNLNQEISHSKKEIESMKSYLTNKPVIQLEQGLTGYFPFESKATGKDNPNQVVFDGNKKSYSNGNPPLTDGLSGKALVFDNEYDEVYLMDQGKLDVHVTASVSMWIHTIKKQATKTQVMIGNAGDKNNFWRGWDFFLDDNNRLSFRLISSLPHNLIHLRSQDSIRLNTWTHIAFSYDGSGHASGVNLFIDGQQVHADVVYDRLYKNTRTISSGAHQELNRPLRVSKSYRSFTGDNGIFKGSIDEIRLYDRVLSELEVSKLAGNESSSEEQHRLLDHAILSSEKIQGLQKQRAEFVRELITTLDTVDEVMIMEEMSGSRPTFVLNRGQYDAPMEEVKPATPEIVMPFPENLPQNRLGLAQWLFDEKNPLTARTTVNRYWQMIFGRGIVQTARDFGNQGALPSHPELLDWLAINFQQNGWDVKQLLKLMVMSSTYQQSSKRDSLQREVDPENILLSVGPSYRWPAELIRDNALAASGLLVRTIGGPSVKPYQPEGLWQEKNTFSHKLLDYNTDKGEGLYRRSLYTFIKRTSPHPVMTVFDVPNRDVCVISRESTNTPLQALVLLNDPQFVEAARILGERMLKEGGKTVDEKITLGFRLVTGRKPAFDEMAILLNVYKKSIDDFTLSTQKAGELLAVGDFARDRQLPVIESAAMAMVGNTMLNMDEAYMKR